MPAAAKRNSPRFFQSLAGSKIDLEAGIIRDVSVITMGPALGHNCEIDRKGLDMSLSCLKKWGDEGVRLIDIHDGEFENIAGFIKDFRIDGNQIKGDAYILENYSGRAGLLEKALKIPSSFGLSIESFGNDEKTSGGGTLFRPSEIDAVALTPRPAANRGGLFSRKPVDTSAKTKSMAKKFSKSLLAACDALRKKFEGEEVPNTEELADAITEAVQDAVAPAVESAVAEQTDDVVKTDGDELKELKARLKKLEDAGSAPSDEEKKTMEEDEEKKLSRIATEAVAKFSKELGVVRPPAAVDPEKGKKSNFEAAVEAQLSAGAKSRAQAITRVAHDKPDIYNAARQAGEI